MLEDLSNDSKCQTHEKQQVSVNANETKILGLHRNKIADKIGIRFPEKDENETNCELLKYLAGIACDFREACDLKVSCENTLQRDFLRR